VAALTRDEARGQSRFALALTGAYLAVAGYGASRHEMWRDEIQAWLLARDSRSPLDLALHLKYEGHPGLWHLLLMPVTRLTSSPVAMQMLHVAIAAAAVFLFARAAPFGRPQKILFAFGYFMIYEYAVLARSYGLGVLLLLGACAVFHRRRRYGYELGALGALLAHTSIVGTIAALGVLAALVGERMLQRDRIAREPATRDGAFIAGVALLGLGVLTAVWQMLPHEDVGYGGVWILHLDGERLRETGKLIGHALLPLLRPDNYFWGSRWFGRVAGYGKLEAVLGLLLVVWCGGGLLRKPAAFLFFMTTTAALLAFFYLRYMGALRHYGMFVMAFVAAAWMERSALEWNCGRAVTWLHTAWSRSLGPVLALILAIHTLGGVLATAMEARFVFSNGRSVATELRHQRLEHLPMLGHDDYAASTVLGFLERREMHYARGDRPGSFVVWDRAREEPVPEESLLQIAQGLRRGAHDSLVLVLNHPLSARTLAAHQLREILRTHGAVMADEDYAVYLLHGGGQDGESSVGAPKPANWQEYGPDERIAPVTGHEERADSPRVARGMPASRSRSGAQAPSPRRARPSRPRGPSYPRRPRRPSRGRTTPLERAASPPAHWDSIPLRARGTGRCARRVAAPLARGRRRVTVRDAPDAPARGRYGDVPKRDAAMLTDRYS
jgi:hypothetical protein